MFTDLIMFIVVAGVLALVVAGLVALALLRRTDREPVQQSLDVQVYRDQLSEIDRDLARGVLSETEAERVRLEVSRRLLDADKAAGDAGAASDTSPRTSRLVAALLTIAIVAGAGGLYAVIGTPGLADQPLSARMADAETMRAERPTQAEFEARSSDPFTPPANADPAFLELMTKLRAAVAENPDELQGQMLLARNEAILGNFRAAHPAMAKLIELRGDAAEARDYATYADLLVLAANGYVSPEAEIAANRTLALEPRNGTARYYLGLMHAQNARPDIALSIWDQLLRASTPEAPWVPPILAQIEGAAQAAGVRYTPPTIARQDLPGPSQDDIEAAGEMEAEDRQAMIRGMVDGLAERLADEGGTADEWARLVNALGVLGDTDRAAAIWAEAQEVFAEDAAGLAQIRNAAQAAGVAN